MEDELPDVSIDELVEHCVAAKARRHTFDGYSPLQWWFGTQCAREVEEHRDLEKIDHILNDDWNFRLLPKQPLFVPTLEKPCVCTEMRIQQLDSW